MGAEEGEPRPNRRDPHSVDPDVGGDSSLFPASSENCAAHITGVACYYSCKEKDAQQPFLERQRRRVLERTSYP